MFKVISFDCHGNLWLLKSLIRLFQTVSIVLKLKPVCIYTYIIKILYIVFKPVFSPGAAIHGFVSWIRVDFAFNVTPARVSINVRCLLQEMEEVGFQLQTERQNVTHVQRNFHRQERQVWHWRMLSYSRYNITMLYLTHVQVELNYLHSPYHLTL